MTSTTVLVEIVHITCDCGVVYGLTAAFIAARRGDQKTFYCPNGCRRHYPAPRETEADKLRRQLEQTRQQKTDLWESLEATRSLARRENARARAFKGHATRLRNAIAQGFCPACDTQFPDVEQHMADEHPDFHPNVQEAAE
jgi:hypothetical protein